MDSIVHIISKSTGRETAQAEIVVRIIILYIIVFLVVIPTHRILLKLHKKIHEKSVLLYDTVRYKVAKAQYANPSIQSRKGIHVIIEKGQKEYIEHAAAIQQEIGDLEQTLGQEIITTDERKAINKQLQKKKTVMICIQILGRPITVLTAGIYKLFR